MAIKCLKNTFSSIEQVNNLREIQALKRLKSHKNIIKLIEVIFEEATGKAYLVMELFDMNLYEAIKDRKNYENEYENGIDYNDAPHCLCIPCYKKVKIKRTKKLNEENYNVVGCNICGVNHLINIKDWNRVIKNDVCCKCDIF